MALSKISPEVLRATLGSSVGTQPKELHGNIWYKQNQNGYEGLAEVLVSIMLSCSNIADYVTYEGCQIAATGAKGCYSKNFLKDGEQHLSFQRAYEMYFNRQLSEDIRKFSEPIDRLNYVVDFFRDYYDLDVTEYLSNVLYLDMLTLNIDRHFNNLSIIVGTDNRYRTAPVFDNGAALFSDFTRFPMDNTIEENLALVVGQPFYPNLEAQAELLPRHLEINYDKLYPLLEPYSGTRAYTVLIYQLDRYKEFFRHNKEPLDTICIDTDNYEIE